MRLMEKGVGGREGGAGGRVVVVVGSGAGLKRQQLLAGMKQWFTFR